MRMSLFGLFFTAVALAGTGMGQVSKVPIERPGVVFKVVSMRFMSKEEGLKRGGLAETDVAIRVRLETDEKTGVEFLSISNAIFPQQFVIERRDGRNIWRAGLKRGEVLSSPGIEHFFESPKPWPVWITLGPNSAIEWEIFHNSRVDGGKILARSVFLKDANEKVFEVLTDFFEVPTQPK